MPASSRPSRARRRQWASVAGALAVGVAAAAIAASLHGPADRIAALILAAAAGGGEGEATSGAAPLPAAPDPALLPSAYAHIGRRPQMEDHTAMLAGGAVTLAAVVDGHEGDGAAAAVAGALLSATAAALEAAGRLAASTPWWRWRPGGGRAAVEAALMTAAASVDAAWLAGPGRADPSGATAAWAVLLGAGRGAAAAWVGDASLVLCRSAGAPPLKLSVDHNLADPAEAARVAAAAAAAAGAPRSPSPPRAAAPAAAASPRRLAGDLAITRAFGDAPYRPAGLVSTPGVAWASGDDGAVALLLVTDGALEGRASPAELCAAAVRGAAAAASGGVRPCDPVAALESAARRSGAIALGGEVRDAPLAAPPLQQEE